MPAVLAAREHGLSQPARLQRVCSCRPAQYRMQSFVRSASNAPYMCTRCTGSLRRAALNTTARLRVAFPASIRPIHAAATAAVARGSLRAAPRATHFLRNAYSTASTKPMRLAIIGSGPAGFYAAHRLMKQLPDALVDMYEKLPVPYGLVRFGVAPDHPEVKNCRQTFEEVAASRRFNYIGNVEVGRVLALADMKPHYDTILFAYGASEDRKLDIPGEDAYSGVYSAREFVGWYNGHPEFAHLTPELDKGEHAVIIGQGNVALDVARMLVKPLQQLRTTDIADHAYEALSRSTIKWVNIVGRRGPLQVSLPLPMLPYQADATQAAFTIKEARELMQLPKVGFQSNAKDFYPLDLSPLPRAQKRLAELLSRGSPCSESDREKECKISFMKAPVAILPDAGAPSQVGSVRFQKTAFAADTDSLSRSAKVIRTDEIVQSPASAVFRSVGYKSTALPGLEDLGVLFDDRLGIIPNDAHGRIISPWTGPGNLTAGHLPGLYAVGWVKRGPTGVIVDTMMDAFTTSDVIVQDWNTNAQFLNTENGVNNSTGLGWDAVKDRVLAQGTIPVDWDAWKRIDRAERETGMELNKSASKFTSWEQMKVVAGLI